MLITSLTNVQGAVREQQEAHSALKIYEDKEMKKLKDAVETLKLDLQSILDLDGVIKHLQSGTQSNIDDAMVTHLRSMFVRFFAFLTGPVFNRICACCLFIKYGFVRV